LKFASVAFNFLTRPTLHRNSSSLSSIQESLSSFSFFNMDSSGSVFNLPIHSQGGPAHNGSENIESAPANFPVEILPFQITDTVETLRQHLEAKQSGLFDDAASFFKKMMAMLLCDGDRVIELTQNNPSEVIVACAILVSYVGNSSTGIHAILTQQLRASSYKIGIELWALHTFTALKGEQVLETFNDDVLHDQTGLGDQAPNLQSFLPYTAFLKIPSRLETLEDWVNGYPVCRPAFASLITLLYLLKKLQTVEIALIHTVAEPLGAYGNGKPELPAWKKRLAHEEESQEDRLKHLIRTIEGLPKFPESMKILNDWAESG
jgi:hypothetical protein